MSSLEPTPLHSKFTGKKIKNFGAPLLRVERADGGLLVETPSKLMRLDSVTTQEDLLIERSDGLSFWLSTPQGYLIATRDGSLYLHTGGRLEELMAPRGWLEGWTPFKNGLCFWHEDEVLSWSAERGVRPVFKAPDAIIGVQYVKKRDVMIVSTGKRVFWIEGATLLTIGSKELPIYGSTLRACWETAAVALTCFEPCVLVASLESRQPLVMSGYHQRLSRLCWSEAGDRLVTVSGTSLVTWRFDQGSPAGSKPFVFDGHVERISSLVCSKALLYSGDKAGVLVVTTISNPERSIALCVDPSFSEVTALCPGPDSKGFFSGNADGILTYWE